MFENSIHLYMYNLFESKYYKKYVFHFYSELQMYPRGYMWPRFGAPEQMPPQLVSSVSSFLNAALPLLQLPRFLLFDRPFSNDPKTQIFMMPPIHGQLIASVTHIGKIKAVIFRRELIYWSVCWIYSLTRKTSKMIPKVRILKCPDQSTVSLWHLVSAPG